MRLLILVVLLAASAHALPKSIFGFAEYEPHETPTPTAKLNVIHDAYVDVIVGNPGRTTRLRIDFGQNTSVVLFTPPDDLSKEFTVFPPTLLVYIGPALVRLTFGVDASLYDTRASIKYDGVLGLGYASDVWDYWGLVSVSSNRLVLGEFDKSLSRATYRPFRLDFTLEHPTVDVTVHGQNFSLVYDPAQYYSSFPHVLYHNITNFDLKFNKLHMEIDNNDIKMKLTSGFDRTLVRKTVDFEDTRIVLGQHFSHNFVLYYNVVNQSKHLMPAFDLFGNEHSEPLYSYIVLVIFFLVFVFWLAIVTAEPGVQPIVFSCVELYAYLAVAIVSIVEIGGFAYFRHVAFVLSTTSFAPYVVLNTLLTTIVLVGVVIALRRYNSTRWLNTRRSFVEAALVLMIWIALTHWPHVMATFVQVLIVSTYCTLRWLQASMAYIVGRYSVMFVNGAFLVLALLFYVFYVLAPIIEFYFFGFAHAFNAGVFIFAFTVALPMMGVSAFYPTSLIRNSTISIDRRYRLRVVPQTPRAQQSPPPPTRTTRPVQNRTLPPGSFAF